MDKELKERKYELLHPYHERDENIGGGVALNKPWTYFDNLIITIDEDKAIHSLEEEQRAIKTTFDKSGQATQTIIRECYFSPNHRTVRNLVAKGLVWCSVTKAYELRERFICQVAAELKIDAL